MKKSKLIITLLGVGLASAAAIIIPVSVINATKSKPIANPIQQNPEKNQGTIDQAKTKQIAKNNSNNNQTVSLNNDSYYFISDQQLNDVTNDIINLVKPTNSAVEKEKTIRQYLPTLLKKFNIPKNIKLPNYNTVINTITDFKFFNHQNKNNFRIIIKMPNNIKIKNLCFPKFQNYHKSSLTIFQTNYSSSIIIDFNLSSQPKKIDKYPEIDPSKFIITTLEKGSIEKAINLIKNKIGDEKDIEKNKSTIISSIEEIKTSINLPLKNLQHINANDNFLPDAKTDGFFIEYTKEHGLNLIFVFDKSKTINLKNYFNSHFNWTYIDSHNKTIFEFFVK